MLLKILQAGDPVLRQKSKPLSKKSLAKKSTQDLIDLMIKTLRDAPGVGIAAPQVGELLQIIVIDDQAKYHDLVPTPLLEEQGRKVIDLTVIVNPKLTVLDSDSRYYFEGCLSVDGFRAVVPRANKVKVTGQDRNFKPITITAEGWLARILQHEYEHLNGDLYIDNMISRSYMTANNFTIQWRKALENKIKKEFEIY